MLYWDLIYSFLSALTSSHIFFLSRPLGDLPFPPLPLPANTASVASSSIFTSFARAAWILPKHQISAHNERPPPPFEKLTWSVLPALASNVESSTPSLLITLAGCPIRVTFSFSPLCPVVKRAVALGCCQLRGWKHHRPVNVAVLNLREWHLSAVGLSLWEYAFSLSL